MRSDGDGGINKIFTKKKEDPSHPTHLVGKELRNIAQL